MMFLLLIASCKMAPIAGGPIQSSRLIDGEYEGSSKHGPNSVTVRVRIQDQRIQKIELLEHDAWKGHKADDILPGRIVEAQSTHVEAVSGATNSSHVIMNAVQDAIEKAYSMQSRKDGE